VLKQLNPGAVEVGIYLVALPEETEGRESERAGNVELCRQKG